MLHRVDELRKSPLFGQLVRFVIAGGLATVVYAVVYSPLAAFGITSEQVANFLGYLFAMGSGYLLHSRWSFRGHGQGAAQTTTRFFAVSLVSYALNTFWVFLLTDDAMLAGPWWWPLIPVLFVTPLVTFALNRFWVFA
ncbi:GtrA family protein [Sphingomonas lenta]|uniref:Polysaccharide synthesis protein GtrA n=1 Tax=Sphingomonas lenta TaxID=1141887 RepID=A0A2A2SDS3_9SPHN|nr:GtrA family protein [Sphingomonas lenta]PAX07434.1 polysaccharide synthesis protein GtrA [Sphingomonas lenta]